MTINEAERAALGRMNSKVDEEKIPAQNSTIHNVRRRNSNESTPPIYFDSEPSSQPPEYDTQESSSHSAPVRPTPNRQQTPAATVNAILALPYVDIDAQRRAERKNKTVLQTIIDTATDRESTLAFNFASQALNNSFFMDYLVRF